MCYWGHLASWEAGSGGRIQSTPFLRIGLPLTARWLKSGHAEDTGRGPKDRVYGLAAGLAGPRGGNDCRKYKKSLTGPRILGPLSTPLTRPLHCGRGVGHQARANTCPLLYKEPGAGGPCKKYAESRCCCRCACCALSAASPIGRQWGPWTKSSRCPPRNLTCGPAQ